ncbi:unnamed protein product [Mytilus coruscus]|uniref:Transposable element P transposase-like RNase H domain-containing protein n=1 Tax=Mytilus coruscus TaxID=42192 RepID=A0A6J8CBP5_MYTCO|nr:unnamed protein product [Mytilus coruscus]
MEELCRLCSSTIPHTYHHLPCDKSRFSRDIKPALKVDIEHDIPSRPRYICESCKLKFIRLRKNLNNRKVKPININVNYQIPNTEINWEQIQQHAVNLGFTFINESSRRYFMKIDDGEVQFSMQFDNNGEHTLKVLGHVVNDQSLYSFPLTSTNNKTNSLAILGSKKVCMGNDDFEDVCRNRNAENLATFVNADGEISALEELNKNRKLVRTVNCLRRCAEGTTQHLLWKQQLEAAIQIDSRQMRWHPILLRWCIALHAKPSSAYKMIKNNKILTLHCENTLGDYTKFTEACSGWNSDVIEGIITDHEVDENALKREVNLLFDEVKIKSGLVYCTETGKLIGFCDLGTVNNELYAYNAKEKRVPELATHILAFMIRGIFSYIECVVAHYPCKGFTSEQLFV